MLDFSSPQRSREASQIALKRKLMEDRLIKKTVNPKKKKEFTKEELTNRIKELLKNARNNIQQVLNQSRHSENENDNEDSKTLERKITPSFNNENEHH